MVQVHLFEKEPLITIDCRKQSEFQTHTMESIAQHIRKIAEESGVDLEAEVSTRESRHTHKGHTIHVSYDEHACHWQAWIKGIGASIGYSDDEALAGASKRIDELTA